MNNRYARARVLFTIAALLVLGWGAASDAAVQRGPFKNRPVKVYFVESADLKALKEAFVSINLHLREEGRSGKIDYKVVIHGPTVRCFVAEGIDPELLYMVQWFQEEGIGIALCAECAEQYGVAPGSVLPGVMLYTPRTAVRPSAAH